MLNNTFSPDGREWTFTILGFYSQGVIVAFLVNFGIISSIFNTSDTEDIRNISSNIQDFLICIEMFMAALAHHFSFSYKCFVNPARGQTWWDAFR